MYGLRPALTRRGGKLPGGLDFPAWVCYFGKAMPVPLLSLRGLPARVSVDGKKIPVERPGFFYAPAPPVLFALREP